MHASRQQQVIVVDDNDAVRDALSELFDSVGIKAMAFDSPLAFLDHYQSDMTGCLVLDIRMPEMSGLELQQKLLQMGSDLSIIFVTGHGDVPMAVKAMKNGAIEFIQKPYRDQQLLDAVQTALHQSVKKSARYSKHQAALAKLATLTQRERQVLDYIVNGQPNKLIAAALGISQRTVENHRASVLEKMHTHSTAALIKLMLLAKVQP